MFNCFAALWNCWSRNSVQCSILLRQSESFVIASSVTSAQASISSCRRSQNVKRCTRGHTHNSKKMVHRHTNSAQELSSSLTLSISRIRVHIGKTPFDARQPTGWSLKLLNGCLRFQKQATPEGVPEAVLRYISGNQVVDMVTHCMQWDGEEPLTNHSRQSTHFRWYNRAKLAACPLKEMVEDSDILYIRN